MIKFDYYSFTNDSISNYRVFYVNIRFCFLYGIDKDLRIRHNVNFYKL